MIKRFLEEVVFLPQFGRQMRFIAGPRQCGKTTIAVNKLKEEGTESFYYNWDRQQVRKRYRTEADMLETDLAGRSKKGKIWVCFDEIHKMPKWKNILKDVFDTHEDKVNFIITGSARLDVMRKAGDSLLGRYFMFRLNPLMMAEVLGRKIQHIMPENKPADYVDKLLSNTKAETGTMDDFLSLSAFPEPLLSGNRVAAAKWHDNYFEKVTKEELRDVSAIRNLEWVINLLYMLPSRIGSPLSLESLRQDLEVNYATVKNYMNYLALTYAVFQLQPFYENIKKSIKKEKKAYFHNYFLVDNEAARFENFIALELKARIDLWNDATADKYGLFYLRTRDKKETDFLITKNKKPYVMFEAKLSDTAIEAHHRANSAALGNIPFVQLVKQKGVLRADGKNFYCVSAGRFLG